MSLRSITLPASQGGDTITFPAQATNYLIVALSFQAFPATGNTLADLFYSYGRVVTVSHNAWPDGTTAAVTNVFSAALDVDTRSQPALAGVYKTLRLPRIIVTPQMTVAIAWDAADVADTVGEVSILLDDEPFSRGR